MAISCVTRNESEIVLAILVAVLKRVEMTNKTVTKQTVHVLIIRMHFFTHFIYMIIN